MARYRVRHDLDSTWVAKNNEGYYWSQVYNDAVLFQNYKEAKEALETLPVEKRSYGFDYKPYFMKFYDSEEHREKEQKYIENKRLLRDFGY